MRTVLEIKIQSDLQTSLESLFQIFLGVFCVSMVNVAVFPGIVLHPLLIPGSLCVTLQYKRPTSGPPLRTLRQCFNLIQKPLALPGFRLPALSCPE